jgi:arsenate reductase
MAERLFRERVGDRHAVRSAGADPGNQTAAESVVIEALEELGIDASDHVPRKLEDSDVNWADIVVAACDVACPVVSGKRYENWGLADPYGRTFAEVRAIRDEIEHRVEALATELA